MENQKSVGSKWKKDRDDKKLTDLRVFWQTIVQSNPVSPNSLYVEKQGTLWGKVKVMDSPVPGKNEGWVWRRYGVKSFDLVQRGFVEYEGIQFEDNSLVFDGSSSYIKINDPGLSIFAEEWEIEKELSGLSSAVRRHPHSKYSPNDQLMLLGINFQIEADLKVNMAQEESPIFVRNSKLRDSLRDYAAHLTSSTTIQPPSGLLEGVVDIFPHVDFSHSGKSSIIDNLRTDANDATSAVLDAMSKNEVKFFLSNKKSGKKNNLINLILKIGDPIIDENNEAKSNEYYTESYELLDSDFHRITVLQDGDRKKLNSKFHYFEFYVDMLQLSEIAHPESGTTIAQHYFSTGESVIYIGYDPITEPGNPKYFTGAIRRLVFDPNASCPECP